MANKLRNVWMLCMVLLLSIGMVAMPTMASGYPAEHSDVADATIPAVEEEIVNFSPVMTVSMTADQEDCQVGQTVTWTITVRNTGNFIAYDAIVMEELSGKFWFIGAMYPGAEMSFRVSAEAEEAGTVYNGVSVSWKDGDAIPDEEEPEEPKGSADGAAVTVREADVPSVPAKPQPPENPGHYGDEIEIPDEDVPLAAAPKSGDVSAIWAALGGISAGGMILLGRKRREDEA